MFTVILITNINSQIIHHANTWTHRQAGIGWTELSDGEATSQKAQLVYYIQRDTGVGLLHTDKQGIRFIMYSWTRRHV